MKGGVAIHDEHAMFNRNGSPGFPYSNSSVRGVFTHCTLLAGGGLGSSTLRGDRKLMRGGDGGMNAMNADSSLGDHKISTNGSEPSGDSTGAWTMISYDAGA